MTNHQQRYEVRSLDLLQNLVEAHGLTHRQLAEVAGYSSHTYAGRLLRGEARVVDPTPAARIAGHFQIPLADLFMPKASGIPGSNGLDEGAAA